MVRRASSVHKLALILSLFILTTSIYPVGQAFTRDAYPDPAHVAIISGNGQTGAAGMPLPAQFVVEVSDASGRLIPGTEVRFTTIAGGGTLVENATTNIPGMPTISVDTDALGRARATLILGNLGNINVVEARAWNVAPVIFTATVISSPPVLNPIGNKQVDEGALLMFDIFATDPDGDALTFSASGMPPGATLLQQPNAPQATFTWMPGFDTVTYGDSLNFPVTFTVTDTWGGNDSEQIIITVRNIAPPTTPDIRVSPTSLDFGTIGVGESAYRSFRIYNDGNAALELFSIRSTDPQFAVVSYAQTNNQYIDVVYSETDPQLAVGPFPDLPPGASLWVKARFRPTSNGSKIGWLVISSNDPDEPLVSVIVQGQAAQMPDIRVTPSSIDFGDVEIGKPSGKILHIHNDGNTTLRIYDVIPTDPQFTVSNHHDVAPSDKLTLTVTFTPSSVGLKTAELIIVSNDPDEPIVSVPLQGTGIAPSVPDIRVLPTSIEFGQVQVGQSLYKTFRIYNDGGATLKISSIRSNSDQFIVNNRATTVSAIVDSAITYVEPGGMVTILAQFKPSSPGAKTGIITITSNDPDEPTKTVSVSGEGTPAPAPNIRLSPSSLLHFGNVDVGRSLEMRFWIYNDGDATLKISSIASSSRQFTVGDYQIITTSDTDSTDIEPGGILPVPVIFAPTSAGTKTGTITVVSNDPDEPGKTLSVQGRGIAVPLPDIRVSSTSMNFGEVEVGRSLIMTLRVYNDGDGTLEISSITSSNSQFAALSYSNVPPGGSIAVQVKFTPASAGTQAGALTINSNDPDEPAKIVHVRGKGIVVSLPDIRISPVSINFGDVQIGSLLDKRFWIYNDGAGTLEVSSVTSNSSQFIVLVHTVNVPSGGVAAITVRFAPSSTGTKTGTITVNSNDPDEPTKTVYVQGKGIESPLPDIRVSPASLNFGEVQLGQSSNKQFWIYNDGDGTLEISSIESSNAQFSIITIQIATVPIISIEPGGVAAVSVSFSPLSLGLKTGVITIASNDPDEPNKTVSVQGRGVTFPVPDIRVSTYSIDFGEVATGSSRDKDFRIYNDGNATLYIYGITSNDSRFVVLNEPNVAPGDMEDVTVRFTPPWIGTYIGTLTIASNDPDEPIVSIAIEGKGVAGTGPDIYLSPYIIDFGDVELGKSLDRSFFIYNQGDAPLYIYNITSSDDEFEILDYLDVNPGDSVEIPIRYAPLSLGSKSATITISSNDPDEPTATVWVYGEGIYPQPPVSNWRLIQQQNIVAGLSDTHFINEDEGWIAGSGGTIAYSADGGETWDTQYSGTNRSLKGVHFTNSNNGWVVGQYGTILKTTNGGYSWSSQNSGGLFDMNAVEFVSYSRGWIVGEAGTILTTNSGYTWTSQNSGTDFDLNDLCFVNSYRGWVVGNYGTILSTSNSGQTWTEQDSGTNSILHGVDFVNHYEGWAVGGYGTILHTQDGGLTWDEQDSGLNYSTLLDVDFTGTSEGWAVGYNGIILHTSDGGSTWHRGDLDNVDETLRGVYFHDANNGWAVGFDGTILKYSGEPVGPPFITSVSVFGSPARAGEVITITARGQSWNLAKFSISGVVSNVTMTESTPGNYTGSYTVAEGINVTNATVIVTLRNSQGEIATDTSRTVTIDSIAVINWANVIPTIANAGDVVTVSMSGEAGGTAKFTIETVITDAAMTEISYMPGSYTGTYTVPQGVNAENVKVTVKLTDALGNVATKEAGRITIDTIALITSVSVDGSPAKFGEPIIVVLTGEANGTARFSIYDLVSNVVMTENQPGVYTGSYTAPRGTDVKNAMVTVQLTDAQGNTATQDAERVTIDTECRIESVTVSGSPARMGQTINVTVIGERSGAARFSIPGVVNSVSMSEVTYYPGKYTGSYTVDSDDMNVTDAVLTVTLTDEIGNVAVDASGRVTIDTIKPNIVSVTVSGSPAKAGETITITVISEPNASAGFSIAGIIYNASMTEIANQPGIYTGSYIVPVNRNAVNAVVTVTLTDAVGNVSSDTSGRVTIDTTKPYISSVSVSGSPAKIGETINITMIGEPGGTAQFTIVGVIDNVPMPESANQQGKYVGTYTVVDDDLSVADAVLSTTLEDATGNVGTDSSKRVSIYPAWDANTDGVVDESDLVLVGMYFGQSVPAGNDADVNRDGFVDVLDVILICRNFGGSTASSSPGREAEKISPEQLSILEKLYESMQTAPDSGDDIAMARKLLAELISLNTVKIARSRLMQNYPNPCNPETWIPYELAEPGEVIISIYSSSGQLIRTLDLGHRNMGSYANKDKAAYWDGQNEAGEKTSSGIYFYVIKSGDFQAVSKMIINR